MAQQQFYTLQSCAAQAEERQTAYENSVVHLGKSSYTPIGTSTKTQLEAAEADYDNYLPITMAAWMDPILSPGSGYMIASPLVQFEVGAVDPVVTNTIGGWYMLDAAGNLRLAGTFESPIPMQLAGQGIPMNIYDIFPTNFA